MHKPKAKVAAAPPRYIEYRKIVIAAGIQFQRSVLPDVKARVPGLILDTTNDSAMYFSRAQGVGFNFSYVRTKSDLKTALETPGIHVVITAHSRYGRGSCFGDTLDQNGMHMMPGPQLDRYAIPLPGDDWEDGATADSGIFRMANRYVPVPVSDIVHHGYTFHPVPADVTLDPAQCHPDIRAGMKSLKALPLSDPLIAAAEQKALKAAEEERNDTSVPCWNMESSIWRDGHQTVTRKPLIDRAVNLDGSHPVGQKFWYFGGANSAEGASLPQLVLYAGWKDTVGAPLELDKSNIQCRALTLLGCSTLLHFKSVLRTQKNWPPPGPVQVSPTDRTQVISGDDGYAHFTSATAQADCFAMWLAALLKYDKYNAGMVWGPSLAFAVQKVNGELANGYNFRIVKG